MNVRTLRGDIPEKVTRGTSVWLEANMLKESMYELLSILDQESSRLAEIPEHAAYIMGELSRIAGVEPKTIRFYEKAGLLFPQRQGKFRIFGKKDVEHLMLIRALRKLGISISAIKQLLRAQTASMSISPEAYHLLENHLVAMRQQELELAGHIKLMTRLLNGPRGGCVARQPLSLAISEMAN